MSAEQTPDIAALAAVIGGIDGDSWDDLGPMAQDACLRAAAAVLDSPVLAAAVREDRESLARTILNTVDPLGRGADVRMECVRIVRADRVAVDAPEGGEGR